MRKDEKYFAKLEKASLEDLKKEQKKIQSEMDAIQFSGSINRLSRLAKDSLRIGDIISKIEAPQKKSAEEENRKLKQQRLEDAHMLCDKNIYDLSAEEIQIILQVLADEVNKLGSLINEFNQCEREKQETEVRLANARAKGDGYLISAILPNVEITQRQTADARSRISIFLHESVLIRFSSSTLEHKNNILSTLKGTAIENILPVFIDLSLRCTVLLNSLHKLESE